MTQLLKRGQVLQGEKDRYTVEQTLSPGQTVVSYLCRDGSGTVLRLEHYQADSPILNGPRSRFLALPQLTGVARPADHGESSGLPFDVFRTAGRDLTAQKVSLEELTRCVIPQLGGALFQLHRAGLLMRNFELSHIFFDPAGRRCQLMGFADMAALSGGATGTRAGAGAVPPQFYPPEYHSMGWSIYSDFYGLGVALLCAVKGLSLFDGRTAQEIWAQTQKGILPGLNRAALTGTDYSKLSVEEKVLYLVLGLTLPDPHQRWGWAEMRCWCAGQSIPLIQTEQRVAYHMSVPFQVDGVRCWDYPQLALALAKAGPEGETLLPALEQHLTRQHPQLAGRIRQIRSRKELTGAAKLFCTVYTLSPAMSGLWWRGRYYQDTAELVRQARADQNGMAWLGELLAGGCLSFLWTLRGDQSPKARQELEIFRDLENRERQERGAGAARFLMRMGGKDPTFSFEGKEYTSLEQLLQDYQERGNELRTHSITLLWSQVFQSWMWAKGMEAAGHAAAVAATGENGAFYALLSLCERCCGDKGKRLSRRLYLRWGPNGPVTWLREHLNAYQGPAGGSSLQRQLSQAAWSEKSSLEDLTQMAPALFSAYQSFVQAVDENPIRIVCGVPGKKKALFRPRTASACFCCLWKEIPVTPAFLRWVGERPQDQQVKDWSVQAEAEVRQWLDQQHRAVPADASRSGEGAGTRHKLQCAAMVVWLLAVLVLEGFCITRQLTMGPVGLLAGLALLVIAAAFPLTALNWHYTQMVRRDRSQVLRQKYQDYLNLLQQRREMAEKCAKQLCRALLNDQEQEIKPGAELEPFHPEKGMPVLQDQMEGIKYGVILALSTTAAIWMPVVHERSLVGLGSMAFCAFVGIILSWKDGNTGTGGACRAMVTGAVCLVLYILFHQWIPAALLAAGVAARVLSQK